MDRSYLERHGNKWRVQVRVSTKAQAVLGVKKLVRPLHTDSLALANKLKHKIVHELKAEIARAENEAARRAGQAVDPLIEEAFSWKAAIEEERQSGSTMVIDTFRGEQIEVPTTNADDLLVDRLEELEASHGEGRALFFARVARGEATPLLHLTESWLAERPLRPRQKLDYKRAVVKFVDWLRSHGLPEAAEATDKKAAGRYVSEAFVAKGVHWKTANKDISALSGYWKWLIKKGHVEVNIWSNQSLPKVRPGAEEHSERPFTDDEVHRLFNGCRDDGELRDAMLISSLSGMRLDEIVCLKVDDCSLGVFRVREGKTAAAKRTIPIHSDLTPIVKRRSAGKLGADYLFHERKDPRPGSVVERGQPLTKRFTRLRRALGVKEELPGKRRSLVNFHSFRRWFAMKAEDAFNAGAQGFNPWTLAAVRIPMMLDSDSDRRWTPVPIDRGQDSCERGQSFPSTA